MVKKKSKNESISPREVAGRVMDMLSSRQLVPGERLTEAWLSERIGIGRSLAREALRILEAKEIVVVERNRGARIVRLTLEEAEEIIEIRGVLLQLMVRRALVRSTADQRKDIAGTARELARIAKQGTRGELNAARQTLMAHLDEISDGSRLSRLLVDFHPGIPRYFGALRTRTDEGKLKSAEPWREFAKHVSDGDTEAAVAAIATLYDQGAREALQLIDEFELGGL